MTPDSQLLIRYATRHDEDAFTEVVQRHLDHVYSTVLRLVGGDGQLAEDVTQAVFAELARQADSLSHRPVLSGWLHTTARFLAAKVVRGEQRRRQREQTALTMSPITAPEPAWDEIRAFLDDSIGDLREADRDAIMLRYFERKPLAEVGAALGVSEDAARMRVDRAVDKLRGRLAARGVTSTAAALSTALAENLVGRAPVAVGSRITRRALATAAAAATAGGPGIWPPLTGKFGIGAGIAVLIVTLWVWSHRVFERHTKARADGMPAVPAELQQSVRAHRTTVSSRTTQSRERAVKMVFQVVGAETGAGIANAAVHAAFFGPGGSGERQDTTTDHDGVARILQPIDPTKTSGPNVFVTAEGYVPKVIGFHGDIPAIYTMKLESGRAAAGRIVDEDGQPVAGVQVGLQTARGEHQRGAENIDFQMIHIVSDDNGRWHCGCIPRDYKEVWFNLKHDDYAVTLPVVPVSQVNMTNLIFVMDRGFTVAGQVTDVAGQPVAKAEVRELNSLSYRRQKVSTDDGGAFVLKGVSGYDSTKGRSPERTASGAYLIRGLVGVGKPSVKLVVQAEGFAPEIQTVDLVAPTNQVRFRLSEGYVFWGRVVDEEGEPVPNAVVQTDTGADGFWTYMWFSHADPEGYFEWRSAPHEPALYWFEAPGYEVRRDVSLLADGSEHEIRLKRTAAK
jgi:RNA polymerase sigma factor (sigma-70 family)